jgi:hypothetical protein
VGIGAVDAVKRAAVGEFGDEGERGHEFRRSCPLEVQEVNQAEASERKDGVRYLHPSVFRK